MKNAFLIFACAFVFASHVLAQKTSGCGERDLKCQADVLTKATQADPKNPENYYNLGVVLQKNGSHKEAVQSFDMYVAMPGLKPQLAADGYNNRGISNRALKRPDLALADFTKAIDLNPKKPEFLVNRGNAAVDLKKSDEALADYGRAIAVDPTFALAYANRGHYFAAMGKLDEALKDLSKAIELDAQNPEPLYTRAMVYRTKREFAKAIPDLDKYIALNPESGQYLADGYLNRGIAYVFTARPEQGLADISKAIELAPGYIDAYQARAILYRQLKKNDLAEADERKVAELTAPPK
jgi:tetratricopeptide (TPR) repeat protein